MEKPNIQYPDSVASRQFVYDLFEILLATLALQPHLPIPYGMESFRRQVAASNLCLPVQEKTHDAT